jgi:hypothetical protein
VKAKLKKLIIQIYQNMIFSGFMILILTIMSGWKNARGGRKI